MLCQAPPPEQPKCKKHHAEPWQVSARDCRRVQEEHRRYDNLEPAALLDAEEGDDRVLQALRQTQSRPDEDSSSEDDEEEDRSCGSGR